MKVRITKAPTGGFGHKTGDQSGFGLYRNERFQSGQDMHSQHDGDTRETYPEVDREKATIEAEKGELIITPGMERLMKIGGKKHSQGGTPLYAEGGEYVVSDHVTGPAFLQDALGFEGRSKKKKDNTWAKLLRSKVDPKDYNRNMEIMEQASAGKEVDPYTLASAKARIPDYQKYISRAALGNEVSKGMIGKPFEIPQVGIPALEAMMGQGSREDAQDHPMMEMRYGGIAQYREGDPVPKKIKKEELDSFVAQGYKKIGDRLYELIIPGQKAKQVVVDSGGPRAGSFKLQPRDPYMKAIIPQGYSYEQEVRSRRIKDTPENKKRWEELGGKFAQTVTQGKDIEDQRLLVTYDEDVPTTGTTGGGGGNGGGGDTPPVKKPKDPTFTGGINKFGRLPYVQDVIGVGNSVANYFDREDYAPTRYRYNPVYMNAPFVTTDAVDNLLMAQANTAAQEASAYGRGAQSQNAVLADIRSRSIPDAIRNRVQTNAQNVQSDLATRQYNTQIANQAGMMDVQSADMFDVKRANFVGNKQKTRATGRTMMAGAINQMLTNSGDTYVMNQRFPNMAFNPITYETAFKGGYGADDVFGGGQSGINSYNDYFQQVYDSLTNVRDEKQRADIARDQADAYFGYTGARTTQRYNPMFPGMGTQISRTSTPASQQAQQLGFAYGGPVYPWW